MHDSIRVKGSDLMKYEEARQLVDGFKKTIDVDGELFEITVAEDVDIVIRRAREEGISTDASTESDDNE